jgi:5,10-methylenetetrahydrofolate reductase
MNDYPQFSAISSEVVEQANAMIQRIKASVSYMTAQNFMNHLKIFFWYHNKEKIKCL